MNLDALPAINPVDGAASVCPTAELTGVTAVFGPFLLKSDAVDLFQRNHSLPRLADPTKNQTIISPQESHRLHASKGRRHRVRCDPRRRRPCR